jgi:protein-tyrosine phosphatase
MIEILVVCTGNICRSPIAAGLFEARGRGLLEPLTVRTAGTGAARGQPPTPEAVASASELGADIGAHLSAPLDPGAIKADLVLAMTASHREEVVRHAPEAAPRTFTLKELAVLLGELPPVDGPPSRESVMTRIGRAHHLRAHRATLADEDVADPIGLSVEAYRATAWEIDEAVQEILRGLFGEREEGS